MFKKIRENSLPEFLGGKQVIYAGEICRIAGSEA